VAVSGAFFALQTSNCTYVEEKAPEKGGGVKNRKKDDEIEKREGEDRWVNLLKRLNEYRRPIHRKAQIPLRRLSRDVCDR